MHYARPMTARSTTIGSWTIPAVAAACILLGAPRPSPAAGPPQPRAEFQVAQADTASQGDDEEEEEEEEDGVPIPSNLLDDEPKSVAPDTTGAAAARDSVATSLPAEPETLRYVPPGDPAAAAKPGAPKAPAIPPAPKQKSGLLGLTPAFVLLSLAVLHILVLRTVGD